MAHIIKFIISGLKRQMPALIFNEVLLKISLILDLFFYKANQVTL